MLRIREDYDLSNLVKDYGFKKADYSTNIYIKQVYLEGNDRIPSHIEANYDVYSEILVNPNVPDVKNNEVRIYFNNANSIEAHSDDFDFVSRRDDLDILFDMIKNGIIIKE